MKTLIQRVAWGEVDVGGRTVARIGPGLLVYVGIAPTDKRADAERLAEKIAGLRIFPDETDKLNLSVQDVPGGVLAVPNFTLQADASKGRRPAFDAAAPQSIAEPLYNGFVAALRTKGCATQSGVFGAEMSIRSEADGPVNIIIEMPPRRGAEPRHTGEQ